MIKILLFKKTKEKTNKHRLSCKYIEKIYKI